MRVVAHESVRFDEIVWSEGQYPALARTGMERCGIVRFHTRCTLHIREAGSIMTRQQVAGLRHTPRTRA